jgi:glycosyltransferase involved in cell wall biosynthesis
LITQTENIKFLISLGAAMIVRDAQDTVERAIRSVSDICSQIVVVDTGSLDATPEICSVAGVDLHFFKWNDNFSDSRNYSLKLLKTDWILSLDADEELDTDSVKNYLGLFKNSKIGGINLIIENILDGNSDIKSRHRYTRIFRNHSQIRFEGSVHEQVVPSITALGLDIVETDIIIRHHGYYRINKDKILRNKELLLKELEKNPDDP